MKLLWVCLKMPKCSFPDMGIRNGFVQHVWNIQNEKKKRVSCFRNGQHHQHPLAATDPRSILIYTPFFNTQTTNTDYIPLDLLLETWLHSEKGGLPNHNRPPTTPPSRNVPSPQQWQIWMVFFTCSHVFFTTIFQPFQPQMHLLIQSARWAVAVASRKTR